MTDIIHDGATAPTEDDLKEYGRLRFEFGERCLSNGIPADEVESRWQMLIDLHTHGKHVGETTDGKWHLWEFGERHVN